MELKEILRGVELFDGLSDDELDQMIALCQQRSFAENEIIAQQDAPGDEMFIIQDGFVEVAVGGKEGAASKVIVNLGQGQSVGEMALIDQGPRSATVRAISDPTIVQVITQEDFESLCEQNNHIGYTVMRNMAADLSFRLRQRHLSDLRG
jgi:CRP-like cAMP-binding protein